MGITLLFIISFILSTIPLTKNIKDTQNLSKKKQNLSGFPIL